MAFFNVEKVNNDNNNTFFNQDPNMYGQNVMNSDMQQPMMNQGWGDPNMQQPMMNQGWGDSNMQQPMMNQGWGDPNMQQPMMNQGWGDSNMQQPMANQGWGDSNMQQPMMNQGWEEPNIQQPMMNQGWGDPNMQQPMANQGWGDSNMQQPMMNQGWDNSNMQQPMYDQQPMFNQPMTNQPYDMNMTGQFVQPDQQNDNFGMNQGDWQQNQMMNQPGFDQQNMDQTMANQSFDNNMVSPSMDNQQPMFNQSMMNEPATDTFVSNVSNTDTFASNINDNIEDQLPELNEEANEVETLGEINEANETLEMPQVSEPSLYQEPTPTPTPDEYSTESSLPREIEKENELDEKMDTPMTYSDLASNLDPLDNANNRIPVNPIFAEIESHKNVQDIGEQKKVKANIFAALGIVFGMVIKPGTTMLNNAKRFREMKKAISIMLWLSFIFLILCIGVRVLVGSFDRTYSTLTDTYKLVFNPARIFEFSNYLEYIIVAVSLSLGGVLLTALIYYASSFLNSKGVHFATYLIVSNLGLIPFIGGVIILYPVCMIVSTYLALGALIFTFLCSLITLLIGMNEVLTFRSINSQIFYHVINLSVITLIAIVVFVFMIRSGWVILPNVTL